MQKPNGAPYVLAIDDDPGLEFFYISNLAKSIEGCDVEFLEAEEGLYPTPEALASVINAKIKAALKGGKRPLAILDNALGMNVQGSRVISLLQEGTAVVMAAGQSVKTLREYSGGGVPGGAQIVGFFEKGSSVFNLINVVNRFFHPLEASTLKPEDVNPEDGFKTLEETLDALKGFSSALLASADTCESDLALGKTVFERALGFINNHITVEDGLAQDEKELNYKSHAVRGLLAVLLSFSEQMQGKSSLQVQPGMSRTLNFLISILEGNPTGLSPKDRKATSLAAVVEEFKAMQKLFVRNKNNTFPAIEADLGLLVLEPTVNIEALRLILTNLLSNAAAHPDIHHVEISGWSGSSSHMILINDDGPALPNNFLKPDPTKETGKKRKKENGAEHMLAIAKAQNWSIGDGMALGAKFKITIPRAS